MVIIGMFILGAIVGPSFARIVSAILADYRESRAGRRAVVEFRRQGVRRASEYARTRHDRNRAARLAKIELKRVKRY